MTALGDCFQIVQYEEDRQRSFAMPARDELSDFLRAPHNRDG
jgi:hypothetical protein